MHEERLIGGRYRLVRRVGGGGMGVVWQAYDERLHRRVAVKQLVMPVGLSQPETTRTRREVVREGRIAARLQHPHVIAVYDVVEEADESFLIMEYLPARSLSQVLADSGRLAPAEVARIGADVADALAAAHAAGVVHRDVKPGNVLLAADGMVKVTDFGISRLVEEATATGTGMVAGTPAYLSPEVARGLPATYASDVFSLGATLFAAVEGTPPAGTGDNPMAVLYRVAQGDLRSPTPGAPLSALLTAMLSVDPARRPGMTDVRDRLRALNAAPAEPAPVAATSHPEPPEPDQSNRHRRRVVILAALVVVLAALAGGTVLLLAPTGEHRGRSAAPATTAPVTTAPSSAPDTTTTQGTRPPPAAPTSPPPPTPPTTPVADQSTPASTIAGYYALMPGNLSQAWTWLTAKYQQHPAGGYSGYQTFWSRIRAVRVSNVNPLSTNQVDATVDYSFKDGRVIRERHRYTLINQTGRWLIDESTVLSSQTL